MYKVNINTDECCILWQERIVDNYEKKVSGYVSVRALGCYDFEFYVDDNATDEEIQQKVDEHMQLSHDYSVEEGYEEYTETRYRKVGI